MFEFELFRMSKCKYLHYYHSPTKLRESNVFTCVHLFTGGHHVIITHDALDLTVQDHAPRLCDIRPSAMRPPSAPRPIRRGTLLLLTSDGHHWRIVQTCSFEEAPPTGTAIWWLKLVWLAGGWYASYWNAFLLREHSH